MESAEGPSLGQTRFRWLLAGRTADQFGNAVQPVALGFAMLAVFGNTTALGVVVGSNALGQVLLLLAGGVVADRLPRSAVLVWSNVVAAVAQAGAVALILSDVAVLPLYTVLAFVIGAAAAFDGPATVALVPEIVPASELTGANGRLTVARRAATLGGAPAAGVLVAVVGPGWTLALDAVSFLVAAGCFSRVGGVGVVRGVETTSPLRDLAEGWSTFVSHTWVWVVVLAFTVINAAEIGGFFVLGLAIAERTIGPEGWGLTLGAMAVGAILYALVAARFRSARPLRAGMLATVLSAGPMLALAADLGLVWLVPTAFLAGAGLSAFDIAWSTALQQHIPGERLARVASIDSLGSFVAIPIGAFIAGPLGDAYGEPPVVVAAAALIVVASLAGLLSREVRDLRAIYVPGLDAPS